MGGGVKRCVTDRSQNNVKKRYEGGRGGVKNLSKKRYVIVEQPLKGLTACMFCLISMRHG